MNQKVGEVSWDSPSLKTQQAQNEELKKVPFLEMKGYDKTWKVRNISEKPIRYYCHFTTDKNGKMIKVNCSSDSDCPVFIEKTKSQCGGSQADARFFLKVIDRADGKIKVLDVGKQIINAIGALHNDEDWGHSRDYDITIKKGSKGSMPLYTVTGSPKRTPLTEEELEIIRNSDDPDHEDAIDLQARIKPLKAETIKKILGLKSKKEDNTTEGSEGSEGSKTTESQEEEFDINWDE